MHLGPKGTIPSSSASNSSALAEQQNTNKTSNTSNARQKYSNTAFPSHSIANSIHASGASSLLESQIPNLAYSGDVVNMSAAGSVLSCPPNIGIGESQENHIRHRIQRQEFYGSNDGFNNARFDTSTALNSGHHLDHNYTRSDIHFGPTSSTQHTLYKSEHTASASHLPSHFQNSNNNKSLPTLHQHHQQQIFARSNSGFGDRIRNPEPSVSHLSTPKKAKAAKRTFYTEDDHVSSDHSDYSDNSQEISNEEDPSMNITLGEEDNIEKDVHGSVSTEHFASLQNSVQAKMSTLNIPKANSSTSANIHHSQNPHSRAQTAKRKVFQNATSETHNSENGSNNDHEQTNEASIQMEDVKSDSPKEVPVKKRGKIYSINEPRNMFEATLSTKPSAGVVYLPSQSKLKAAKEAIGGPIPIEQKSSKIAAKPPTTRHTKTHNPLKRPYETDKAIPETAAINPDYPEAAAEMENFYECFPSLRDSYRLVSKVGEGAFSTVYKAVDLQYDKYENLWDKGYSDSVMTAVRNTDKISRMLTEISEFQATGRRPSRPPKYVAIKRIHVTAHPRRIASELSLLKRLSGSSNLLPLITGGRYEDQVIAVIPFFEHDDFRDFYDKLTIPEIRIYFKQLFNALAYIHDQNIIHRDVKAQNFLYNRRTFRGVLVDFGLAERISPARKIRCECKNGGIAKIFPELDPDDTNKSNNSNQKETATSPASSGSSCTAASGSTSQKYQNSARANSQPGGSSASRKYRTTGAYTNAATAAAAVSNSCIASGKPIIQGGKPCNDTRHTRRFSRAGTRGFRAPEVLFGCPDQTVSIDIWSAGIMLLSFLAKRCMFFQAKDDSRALIEMATIFGTKQMRKTALLHGVVYETTIPTIPSNGYDLEVLINWCLAAHYKFKDASRLAKSSAQDNHGESSRKKRYKEDTSSGTNKEPLSSQYIDQDIRDTIVFLRTCLELDFRDRITAVSALEHPFLKDTRIDVQLFGGDISEDIYLGKDSVTGTPDQKKRAEVGLYVDHLYQTMVIQDKENRKEMKKKSRKAKGLKNNKEDHEENEEPEEEVGEVSYMDQDMQSFENFDASNFKNGNKTEDLDLENQGTDLAESVADEENQKDDYEEEDKSFFMN